MRGLPAALDPLLDRSELDLAETAQSIAAEEGDELDLERLITLAGRLPSGLVHAEAIWISAVAPVGLLPLAPGSAWYALEQALVAAIAPGRGPLQAVVGDLARYAMSAAKIRAALVDAPALVDDLIAGQPIEGARATELALRLGNDPSFLAQLDVRAPGLGVDLAWMARQPFSPRVHLHPSTRPVKWRRLGQSIGRRLCEAAPEGPIRLFLADTPEALEHLSPYVRDLTRELLSWARENPSSLRTPFLLERLSASPGQAADLAALVVPDLLAGRPEVLEERRRVEHSAGIQMFDEAGATFGLCELGALASPDPRSIATGAKGTLVIAASGAAESLIEIARELLDRGRVSGLGIVMGFEGEGGVVLPELVISRDDAIAIEGSARLLKKAEAIGVSATALPRLASDVVAPQALLDLLRLVRRAELLAPGAAIRRVTALYPRSQGPLVALEGRIRVLDAARVALLGLTAPETPGPSRSTEAAKASGSLRFRA